MSSQTPILAQLHDMVTPTVRLGVTGLSRAGKTVLITALVRTLTAGGRLPFFSPMAEGRILRAYLEPQPDDTLPRFDYEGHLAALAGSPPDWPESTRRISQLRVTIDYQPTRFWRRQLGAGRLHVDIVDYPGEWLIDLGMMGQGYAAWSAEALRLARAPERAASAAPWLQRLTSLDPDAPQDEQVALDAARRFTAYLTAARAAEPGLSTLGPGRFLMPGDLAGSPLLTFAPLELAAGAEPARGSLAAMMARRFESYKSHVVMPFFRDHFSRLDRQIVLVDALAAIGGGRRALDELTGALERCLSAFRPGRAAGWLALLTGARVDRILFAASKADHLHHTSHDRLEAALRLLTDKARDRAAFAGAEVGVVALAALRATREAEAKVGRDRLPCIVGVPLPGQRVGTTTFDGVREASIFPGDLPVDPAAIGRPDQELLSLVGFRPPRISLEGLDAAAAWPHIRLDRALQFLLGDRLA